MADWTVYALHLEKPLVADSSPGGDDGRIVSFSGSPSPFMDDPDEGPDGGPRLSSPLTAGASEASIPAGDYRFMQWRPGADAVYGAVSGAVSGAEAEASLREGLEHFARELWWMRVKTEGPWFFRALREDGKIAFQLLRRDAPEADADPDHSSTP